MYRVRIILATPRIVICPIYPRHAICLVQIGVPVPVVVPVVVPVPVHVLVRVPAGVLAEWQVRAVAM
jgi:hypothetical protein